VPGVGPELGIGHVPVNHYMGSGACYYQMGESMGRAMLEMGE